MGNFDSKTAKIMIALIAIFAMIVICLPYSYRNMNQNLKNEHTSLNKYSVPVRDSEFDTNNIRKRLNNSDIANNEENNNKNKNISKKVLDSADEFPSKNKLEIIDEVEPLVEIDTDNLKKANSLRNEKKFESAVYEYEQIAKSSDDVSVKAKCYEEIAVTYAIMKRYSSAVPFAEKAYNTEPAIERKLLLARLLYKTGHEESAKDKVSEILNSDFE